VTEGSLLKLLCRVALLAGLTVSCTALVPAPTKVECAPLPDASQTLLEAWQAHQPDQSISLAVTVRRRLFAFQSLLLSAGMYDDQPPTDPATVYATYAPQFVRDFGMSHNPGLADALRKLDRKLLEVRNDSETRLGNNCGLILARRALRDDALNISTDWILQTVTLGFAAYFQSSIRQLIHEHAQTCSGQPEVAGSPEAVLDCTMRGVGV
jgi:hypothetical protein